MMLVCEIMFNHGAHVPFNAGLMATIHAAFPNETVSFYGASYHIEELKKQLGQQLACSIHWHAINNIPPSSGYLDRLIRELRLIRRLLRTLTQDPISRLVLTSAFPSTVLALKIARWFYGKHILVQMVLHGVSGVVGKRHRHPIRRFQEMKTALTLFGNKNIQYIVLEEPVRDTIVQNVPLLSGRIEALDHPISPNEGACQTIDLNEPVRFGFLGVALKTKGFPLFVRLANEASAIFGPRVEFHAIGLIRDADSALDGTNILATKPTREQIPRADFISRAVSLHFVILPHEANQYAVAASGVLLDAIAWGKPIIARKIPIFELMFQKYGDIGYLFKEDVELREIVQQVLKSPDKARYRRQVLNLQNARKSRHPETLAASYRELCKRGEDVV
jgi:glycosyltransferase involved in cell wall biosynthesis